MHINVYIYVSFLRYVIPSHATLVNKLIPEERDKIAEKLKEIFSKLQSITLSVDVWTNRRMASFLGVTAHYIKDWELKSSILACR